jgi:hypothetical protein
MIFVSAGEVSLVCAGQSWHVRAPAIMLLGNLETHSFSRITEEYDRYSVTIAPQTAGAVMDERLLRVFLPHGGDRSPVVALDESTAAEMRVLFTALEEEAVKALTGESQLDLSIVNQMLLKHRAKLEASQTAMEEAQTRMQAEQENAKATKAQVDELLSWAQCFDKADIGTKHLIVSRLIERVDVRTGYKVHIKFKISLKQFLGQE